MIDVKKLKENPEILKKLISAGRGNPEKANVDELLRLDSQKNELTKYIQDLNAERSCRQLCQKPRLLKYVKEVKI